MKLKLHIFALMAMLLCAFSANAQVTTEAELRSALATGGDVTLGGNINVGTEIEIPEDVTVVLDLAGYDIIGGWNGASTTNHIYVLRNYGTLTIKDSGTEGKIVSRGVYNHGKLTLESGTIDACDGNGGYAVNNESGSTFIMNGGVVSTSLEDDNQSDKGGYDATALDVPAGCEATLNGGKVTSVCDFTFAISAAGTLNIPSTSTVVVEGNHGAISVSGGVTTIDAGTFKVIKDNYTRTDNVTYVSGGQLIINGGTFEGDSDVTSGGCCVCDEVGGAKINGGSFSNTSGGDVWGTTGTTINGGTFENLTETSHVTVGATITNGGKTYTKAENGDMVEATIVEVATYDQLVAALANSGAIKLTADITVDSSITAIDGTVLDLNEKTLYINVENSFYDNVTIKNGNIVLGKDDVHVCDGYFEVNAGKTLVLDGVNMSSSAEGIKGYAVFHLKTGANLDLLNSTLNIADNEYAAGYIVYAGEATATVDIVNTTITGSKVNGIVHATTVIDESTVTLTDVTEHGINRSGVTIDDSNVAISGGAGRGITAQHGDLVITGNSTVEISDMGEATIELRNDKSLSVEETANVTLDVAVNNTTSGTITGTVNVPGSAVAKIGETGYATLAEAVAAATEGATITLVADVELTETLTIPASKTITLDLNSKTVSMTDASAATAAMIKNNGTLTINDLSAEKNGKLTFATTTPSTTNSYASNTISNYGTITIEAGTIENTSETGGACYALDNYAGSTATINGGKFTATKTTVRIFNWTNGDANKATLNVNGGEIYSKDGYAINVNSGNAPAVALNITGGTFTTDDTDYNLAVYVVNKNNAENFTANVTGGTFNGYFALNGFTSTTMAEDAVSISGGTFNKGVICYEEPAYGFITGGTFTEDVNNYCADGFVCEANNDGTYGIVADPSYIAEFTIDDAEGIEYTNDAVKTVGKLTYKRTFVADIWNALYLPFDIELTEELLAQFDFYEYNQMLSKDTDGDRVPDDFAMELFVFQGGTLEANYPYFVRPKDANACTLTLEIENATLYAAEENSFVTTSMKNTFTLSGTHKPMTAEELAGKFVMSTEGKWQTAGSGMKPHRLSLSITDRDGNSVVSKAIRMVVRGEDGYEGTTGIEEVEIDSNNNVIYDLSGRRVAEPVKGGIYIVNGKKVIF